MTEPERSVEMEQQEVALGGKNQYPKNSHTRVSQGGPRDLVPCTQPSYAG